MEMISDKQAKSGDLKTEKSLRLLPGIIIIIIQSLVRFALPAIIPSDEALMIAVFGGVVGGLAVVVWWLFFSHAPKLDRYGTIVLMVAGLFLASRLLDKSIATANMGLMFILNSIPVMSLAFVLCLVASRHLSVRIRRTAMIVTILLASGVWTLLRTNGMSSNLHYYFTWRWAKTQEEIFLAQTLNEKMIPDQGISDGRDWPGFRGPDRDGIVHGSTIKTDWISSPPEELWRRQIGPGCSSFAVKSGLLFTQEQRGDEEVVTCYNLSNGELVWIHSDKARFWDSHAGAGPRATPTFHNNRIYTFGATGILNALDAMNGSVIWSRNAANDTGAKNSGWGFTSSPLVTDSLVFIAASGILAAYDLATGRPEWLGPDYGKSYSSPHLITIDGVNQIVLMSDSGAISLAPSDGKLLWKHLWPLQDRVLQPAITTEGNILLNGSMTNGTRSITVVHESDNWKVTENWTTTGLKPNFNDFVVHNEYAYGFNGRSLTCINIKNGRRTWQQGRYGGQLLLLADQDILLVLTETGELALVAADPEKFTELSRVPAIKGRTWNHPILAQDILVVRNSEEMAAFSLSPEGR